MQPYSLSFPSNSMYWFQSSSGQKAGCNVGWLRYPFATGLRCFNPHPARRPDATAIGVPLKRRPASLGVSILIRPEGRMQPQPPVGRTYGPWDVSILIRPEGRMQRLYLNFLSVLREPPDTALPICFHCPDHSLSPATIQLRTRISRLQWLQHWVRVRPPAVP